MTRITTLAALILAIPLAAFAEDFEIRLHRTSKVGFRTRVSGKITHQVLVKAIDGDDERQLTNKRAVAVFDFEVKVLEVGKLEMPSKVEVTVNRFQQLTDDVEVDLFDKGARIVAKHDKGRKVFETEKGEPSREIAEILGHLLSLEVEGDVKADESFGTRDRKKVGETWEINRAATIRALTLGGFHVEEKNLRGQTRLESVSDHRLGRCLVLAATLEATKLSPPDGPQQRSKLIDGAISVKTKTWLPVDSMLQAVDVEKTEIGFMTFAAPNSAPGMIRVEMNTQKHVEITPLN